MNLRFNGAFMGNKLSRGIINVLIANVINLLFNLASNFLLPKYLSVDAYAHIKTFTLLLTYAGFLHFGYADGMYLKYGGVEQAELDTNNLDNNLSTMRIFQAGVSIILVAVGIAINSMGVIIFGLTLLPYNMSWYFRNLYQAIGSFKAYSKVINFITIALFVCNMTLLFWVRTDYYGVYLLVYLVVYFGAWAYMEIRLRKILPYKFHLFLFSLYEFKDNIANGFLLMLGNFSSNLLTSMDRWFVKAYLDNLAFAQYSFAVSMESFLNVALTPIAVTLYNFFCKTDDIAKINKIKQFVMIFAAFIISSAFWGDWILHIWLTKYIGSADVLYFLFCSQFFYFVIKSIYINLYKAQKRQRTYFVKLIIIIVYGFAANYLFFKIVSIKESFALATLTSAALWFILCALDFKNIGVSFREVLYSIICIVAFLLSGIFVGSLLGFAIYISIMLMATVLLFRNEFLELITFAFNAVKSFAKKHW